jgi:flagellar basal-body rod protein FlgB
MDYSSINLLKLMRVKMAYHSERQDVLAKNIANIDTPGYAPRDLKPLDFNRLAMIESNRLQMRATSASHIMPTARSSENFRANEMRNTYETKPVENSASVEQQSMMIAENQMEHQKVTNLYAKVSGMFKTAIGKN